jgi:hypothetical protein
MKNTSWPNDADGDVFRRLASKDFDFAKPRSIDFTVDFENWPPSPEAIAALREQFPDARVIEAPGKKTGYVLFKIEAELGYKLVKDVQARATRIVAPYNGWCDSWGVLS